MAQKITTIDFIIILLQHMDIGSEITQKTDSSPDISISPAHIVLGAVHILRNRPKGGILL